MNTSTKGNYAELLVATEATRKGYYVGMMPAGCPYDMVIDKGNGPQRVQVKYRKVRANGVCEVPIAASTYSGNYTTYNANNIDVIAVVEGDNNTIAWVPIKEVEGKTGFSIRVIPTRNNQSKGVIMFESYTSW